MRTVRHSPPYVAELGQSWRIVVPIRGKLSPRLVGQTFASRQQAVQFLASEEGQHQVEMERCRPAF